MESSSRATAELTPSITFFLTQENQQRLISLAFWRIKLKKKKTINFFFFAFSFTVVKITEFYTNLFPTLRVNSHIVLLRAVQHTHLPLPRRGHGNTRPHKCDAKASCSAEMQDKNQATRREQLPIEASAWLDKHWHRNRFERRSNETYSLREQTHFIRMVVVPAEV